MCTFINDVCYDVCCCAHVHVHWRKFKIQDSSRKSVCLHFRMLRRRHGMLHIDGDKQETRPRQDCRKIRTLHELFLIYISQL